jgi:hypothetical protein
VDRHHSPSSAKTSGCNQVIDSGMPPFGGPLPCPRRAHAQLAIAENLTTSCLVDPINNESHRQIRRVFYLALFCVNQLEEDTYSKYVIVFR